MIRYGNKVGRDEVRNVKARSLIANFEKGEVVRGDEEQPAAITATVKSPEVVPDEQAAPGTTRKLLAAFQQLDTPKDQPTVKSPTRKSPSKALASSPFIQQQAQQAQPAKPTAKPTETAKEAPAEQAKPEEPKEVPKAEEPKEAPKPEEPKEAPKPEEPKEVPKPEEPKEAPKPVETPKAEEPKEEPKPAEAPVATEAAKPEEPKETQPEPVEQKEVTKSEEPKEVPQSEEPAKEEKPTEKEPEKAPEVPVPQATAVATEQKEEVVSVTSTSVTETATVPPQEEDKPSEVAVEPQTTAESTVVKTETVTQESQVTEVKEQVDLQVTKTEEVVVEKRVEDESAVATEVIKTVTTVVTTTSVEQEETQQEEVKPEEVTTTATAAPAVQATAATPSAKPKKRALLVYAGLPKKSTDASLRDVTVKALEAQGCEVTVSDLVAQNFNPVLSLSDIGDPSKDDFDYVEDLAAALDSGALAKDVLAEQAKVRDADLVVIHYQTLLHEVPALVLGWLQRVLLPNFAFDVKGGKIYDDGLLKGKRALLSITSLGPSAAWSERGILGDINVSLWPLQNGILRFCGFDVLTPQLTYGLATLGDKDRDSLVTDWETRLRDIFTETPVSFIANDKFDAEKGWVLKDQAVSELLYQPGAPTVGQHLGRPLPVARPSEK